MDDQKLKKVIVTGATGAIGKAIALGLAKLPNHSVFLVARDKRKAELAVMDIVRKTGNENISYLLVDLSCKEEIFALAEQWEGKLSILINNAGITPRQRRETSEGIEMQFATNVLGYFWMIKAFTSTLKEGSPSRVVNVASYWAGDLDLSDLEFKRRPYHNGIAYRQSKQANRMLTVAFAERLKPFGISVNACHPGDVNSKLSNDLGFGGHESPTQGAETPVWLASDPSVSDISGGYFAHKKQENCPFNKDKQAIERLFEICSNY